MAFAGGGLNSPSARDTAPGPRFFVFAVLSILLMYFDQRDGWSQRIRYVLQGAAYPVQVAVGSPRLLWNSTVDLFSTRATLRRENTELKARERELSLTAMRFAALEQENARLRGLVNGLPPLVKRSQLADVVSADLSSQRQRLVIDQGDRAGLFRSQAIVDATGLVGQLVRVGPWSAEVMLISDPGHAVPVEVLRNGVRTVAEGTGNEDEMRLSLLPATADVKAGDTLVTSGLGGVFPAGIPVGTVVEAVRDPDDILARVRVRPRASLARDRQVMALWFNPESPMAPVDSALVRDLPEAPLARPVLEPPSPVAKVTKP
ncbi:MAG: rod shape-determining protein MreC [Proteobacteria bacterium]|nr:rod shape-determining protein MreC [Pseudomonadota bacterium]